MWKLSIEDDQGHKTVVSLLREEYSIGRSQENTVRLTERNISRRHAILRKNAATWALEDQSSYNGCFVNGARVSEPKALSNGDLVQLGDYRLEMVDDAAAAIAADGGAVSAPTAVGSLTGQPDRLVMVVGPTPGAEFALDQERIVIGRGEECDVAISHGSVSRVHAEIRQLGDGRFELLDRESANGVRVNGIELGRALLDARDVIELGDIVFKFIPAGEVYRPSSHELKRLGPLSQEPATAVPVVAPVALRAAWTPAVKIAGVAALVVLAVLIGVFAMGERRSSGVQTASGAAADDAVKILGVAKAALDRGEVEKAHTLAINGVPESSNARHAPDFLEIEARWADLIFAKADRETDREKKRALYDQVASATSVDSARRKQAADFIAGLGNEAAPVAELPHTAKPGQRAPVTPPEPPTRPASQPVAAKRQVVAAPAPEPAPVEAPAPAPKPATQKTTSGSTGVTEQATSGDRARQIAAKDALKAKVASGHASEQDRRLLRALCRQFSDPSCSN
jgi:pSer/pThr/pTyr-binding forkhead associated (FHA) protein